MIEQQMPIYALTCPSSGFRIINCSIVTMPSMEKAVKLFHSCSQADEDDKRFYRSLSPADQLDILLKLIAQRQAAQAQETTDS
jgi:hypothetical protein